MSGRFCNDEKRELAIIKKLANIPDYVSEWNDNMKASGLTSSTRNDYVGKVYKMLTYISENPKGISPDSFTKLKINTYLASLTNIKTPNGSIKESSDSYKQTVWCCLNNFFNFLKEYKYINENPINIKRKPKNKDMERVNSNRIRLTSGDFEDILGSVSSGAGSNKSKTRQLKWKNRDLGIIMLLMSTGMRETALAEIDIDDINFSDNSLRVIDKGNKTHIYYLNNKTMNVINSWIEDREMLFPGAKNSALFLTYQGNRITAKSLYKLVKKYSQDALGEAISPHKIRAGFCSIMYDNTKDIEKVRRMVGHSNVATTQRYVVTPNMERKEAAEIMETIF